jgi:hypothetical protein
MVMSVPSFSSEARPPFFYKAVRVPSRRISVLAADSMSLSLDSWKRNLLLRSLSKSINRFSMSTFSYGEKSDVKLAGVKK